jgi:hypothetical protein
LHPDPLVAGPHETPDRVAVATPHRRSARVSPSSNAWLALVALSGVVALASPAAPTASAFGDRLFALLFAAGWAFLAARARRWTWFVAAGVAAATAPGGAQIAGLLALGVALFGLRMPGRSRRAGAVVGGLAANALLWGSVLSPGAAAVCGAAVTLCLLLSALRASGRRQRCRILAVVGGLTVLVAVSVVGYAVGAFDAKTSAQAGLDHLRAGLDAAKANDPRNARDELSIAADDLSKARESLDKPWAKPLRAVPILGRNARAVETMTETGASLAATASSAASAADLDSIQVSSGQIDLNVIDRVGKATIDVSQALDRAQVSLEKAQSSWLLAPVADRLHEALDKIAEAQPAVANVRDGTAIAPVLLGRDKPQHYLVLFVTPSEARGSVGFPGNFAELETDNGRVRMTRFGRLQQLQDEGLPLNSRSISGPLDYLARYSRFAPAQTWHNITMSPDFPSVARVAAELYPQSGGSAKIDGVFAVDPTALAALLELTGPVQVEGLADAITSTNAVSYLQTQQYIDLPKGQRVDMLQEVARATFERLTNGNLPAAKRTLDVLAPVVAQGHLRFVSFDGAAAKVLARAKIDGAIPPVRGDDIAVITNNAGGNKLDAFLQRSTSYHVDWDSQSGSFSANLTVRFKNNAPSSGLPDYIIGNSLSGPNAVPLVPGTNRMWVSIYSPWRYDRAAVDGVDEPLQLERELGRYVASSVIDVPPGQTRTVTITWRGRLQPADRYRLDLTKQPQALAEPFEFSLSEVNGRSLQTSAGTVVASNLRLAYPAFDQDLTVDVSAR